MRFVVEPHGLDGNLKVIREIPDFALCYLEGKNGIGKTLALHLLEIATGHQPYLQKPAAWESLRRALGPITISIHGSDGTSPLTIRLYPDRWPETPQAIDAAFGEAETGGQQLSIAEVSKRLRVLRVAGDETFEKTIRARIEADAVVVEQVRDHLAAEQEALNDNLQNLDMKLGSILPQRFEDERARSHSLRERLATLEDESS